MPGPADAVLPELVEGLLAGGRRVRFAVGGCSMAPRLRGRDHVVIEPLGGDDARFGDLVLFQNADGALVLHRVVRRWQDRIQTRGDANVRLDVSIDPACVLGRVRWIERYGRDNIDLETVRERLRAVATGAGNLLCSALYYKLGGDRKKLRGHSPAQSAAEEYPRFQAP